MLSKKATGLFNNATEEDLMNVQEQAHELAILREMVDYSVRLITRNCSGLIKPCPLGKPFSVSKCKKCAYSALRKQAESKVEGGNG